MFDRRDIADFLIRFESELHSVELLLGDTVEPEEEIEDVIGYRDVLSQIVDLLESIHDPPLKQEKALRILAQNNTKKQFKGYT